MYKMEIYPHDSTILFGNPLGRTYAFFALKKWLNQHYEQDQYIWLDREGNITPRFGDGANVVPYYIAFETEEDAAIFKLKYNL